MYLFIVNPIAGNGRAKRIFKRIQMSSTYKSLKSMYFYTEYEGHAEEIVRTMVTKKKKLLKGIIVIGGDGTLHEAMNGLQQEEISIALIPGGSGNDFARGLSIEKDPINILERMLQYEKAQPYWLGVYETNPEPSNKRYFVNNIGFGFDAQIAKTANNAFYKKIFNVLKVSRLSYVFALIQGLFKFRPMEVIIEVEGKERFLSNCWMVTISNHPYLGGGMKLNPKARIQPGKFSVFLLHSISKLKVLSLFFTVFFGAHIRFKEVEIIETNFMKITAKGSNPLHIQVDGETSQCHSCVIRKQTNPVWMKGLKKEK